MDTGLALIFLFSFCSLFALRKVAEKIQLVDVPSGRKQHQGVIPLVGGLAIFSTVALALFIVPDLAPRSGSLPVLLCGADLDRHSWTTDSISVSTPGC